MIAFLSSFDLDYSLSSRRSTCHHRGASRALSNAFFECWWARGWLARLAWVSFPGKGLAGETCFAHLIFVALVLVVASASSCASILPWLTSLALLGVVMGAALTARAQVKGYKNVPLVLYTDKMGYLRRDH